MAKNWMAEECVLTSASLSALTPQHLAFMLENHMSHRVMVTEVEGHQVRTPEDTAEEGLLHPITEVAGDLPVRTREEGPPLHITVIVATRMNGD